MFKSLHIVLVILTFASACLGQSTDFRKTEWGMSKNEVKALEPLPLQGENQTSLVYQDSIAGIDVVIGYTFSTDSDQLIAGGYLSQSKYKNQNEYIDDFNTMKKYFTGKYGEPKLDKVRWLNNFFKNSPEKAGFAVALGHAYYLTEWDTPNSVITMTLSGQDYEIQHLVSFKSKQYSEKLDHIRKQAEEIYNQKYGTEQSSRN